MTPSGFSNLFYIHCLQWHSLLSCFYLPPSTSGKVSVYTFLKGKTSFSLSILYASNQHYNGSTISTRSTKSSWEAWTSQVPNPERNLASNPDISPPWPCRNVLPTLEQDCLSFSPFFKRVLLYIRSKENLFPLLLKSEFTEETAWTYIWDMSM